MSSHQDDQVVSSPLPTEISSHRGYQVVFSPTQFVDMSSQQNNQVVSSPTSTGKISSHQDDLVIILPSIHEIKISDSPKPKKSHVSNACTVLLPNPIQITLRNQSATYAHRDILSAYAHYHNHIHCHTGVNMKKGKKEKKAPKSKGCWRYVHRKGNQANNKAKKVTERAKKIYGHYIRIFLLIKGILGLSAHVADVGTDGNTAYSHYNNQDFNEEERMFYGNVTVIFIIMPMIPACIIHIKEIIANTKWSLLQKCLMVGLCVVIFPINAFIILLRDVLVTYRCQDPRCRGSTARKAGVMKLSEAMLETLPQLLIQFSIISQLLGHPNPNVTVPSALWLGVATSLVSLVFTISSNDVFGGYATMTSRLVWFIGFLVGIPPRLAVMSLGGYLVLAPMLTFSLVAFMRHVYCDKLKQAPQLLSSPARVVVVWYVWGLVWAVVIFLNPSSLSPWQMIALGFSSSFMFSLIKVYSGKLSWAPLQLHNTKEMTNVASGDSVWDKRLSLAVVCLWSMVLSMLDSCCSIKCLPLSGVILVISMLEVTHSHWPQPMALAIVVLSAVTFIINMLLTLIPQCRVIGEDWDNAWDNTEEKCIKWIKKLVSCQPQRSNDIESKNNGDGNAENCNDANGNDNNFYDIAGYVCLIIMVILLMVIVLYTIATKRMHRFETILQYNFY